MLSGIKKGKRKRKLEQSESSQRTTENHPSSRTGVASSSSLSDNYNAAQELRRMLSQSKSTAMTPMTAALTDTFNDSNSLTSAPVSRDRNIVSEPRQSRVYWALNGLPAEPKGDESSSTMLLMTSKKDPMVQKEDFKRGAKKGKLKLNESVLHADMDKSIQDLVEEEKQSQLVGSMGMDEIYARNVARLGSRYKGSEFKSIAGSSAGADEDDMAGDGGMDMTMFVSNQRRLTEAAKYQREMSAQIALANKEQKITSRCWWWMESSSFEKHRLLSLGDHVSLVFVPSNLALVKSQCYLVPIKHADSFASCEDEVWDEVARFRTCLRNMFAHENKGVLFCETILPSKGLWQARMDVIPVPKTVEHDAEIFFKSALTEQAEEWGTHNKILSTRGKGLRRTVPKGFPYFNVEWDDGGYAQIIETHTFPKDFGTDTIAGMMDLDPIRFNRKSKPMDHDREAILDFLERWKKFDWTLSMDSVEQEPE